MSRLDDLFATLGARNECALMPYLTAGDPSLALTERLIETAAAGGADILEVGVPFSDPLMDGPVIQESANRALAGGTTPEAVLGLIRRVRPRVDSGLVLMLCYNLVYRYGPERFAADAQEAGVDGVLITDLPPEEAGDWERAARSRGLDTIYLLAPTSTPRRIALVAAHATGFIYCISRRGVTGVQETLPPDLEAVLARIRARTDRPIAVGFGLSRPEHVRQVAQWAEGAVVGSALVQTIAAAAPDETAQLKAAGELVRQLKAATRPEGGI